MSIYSWWVRLLAVEADVAEPPAVGERRLLALDEHAAQVAAGVVTATLVPGDGMVGSSEGSRTRRAFKMGHTKE